MQTLVDIYCTRGTSLREAIANDRRLAKHGLEVLKEHQPGRAPGWAKLRGNKPESQGTVNYEWDASAQVLRCRVVNRGRGRPHNVVGDLVEYLLARHRSRILGILIVPQKRPSSVD